ncbi:MAG: hypothetical protein CVT64_11975 [Actinobacteria bacterium HGW-Actinobacteria-4]|nr:MAG: hypothetical protein CVT64_11975 [Actinobacteria bacterium HGW-Actinobacteria-4]
MTPFTFEEWPEPAHKPVPVDEGTAYVSYSEEGQKVTVNGLRGPRDFTYVEVPAASHLPRYVVECTLEDSGTPRINSVHVQRRDGERDVLSEDLARLRSLEDVVEVAWIALARQNLYVIQDGTDLDAVEAELNRLSREQVDSLRRQVRGLRKRPRSRVSDEKLEEVARIYRGSRAGGKPAKTVAEQLGMRPSTASWYIKRAEEAGKDLGGPRDG